MPFLIPAAIAIGSSISAGLAAAGTALAVAGSALVAGDFALAGTALLAVGDASLIGGFTVGSILEVGALAGISALLAPHPKVNTAGSPQQFKPDPNAGLPVVMGRYGVGGNLVYQTTSGGGNKAAAGAAGNEYLTSFVILSALGPVQAFETLRFNDTILTFDPNGQACNGGYIPYDEVQSWNPGYRHQNADGSYINNNYQDRAWQNLQLGALNAGYFAPPSKLASDNAALPEWTTAHGFSSFCAASLTLVYDQRYYAGGVPQYQWVLQGIKLYDPRKDSTYPGGAGPHRWAGEGASAAAIDAARATWEFTQNPLIHALNYALGHFLPDAQMTGPNTYSEGLGRLYAGIGAGTAGVDLAAFVRAANIADANTWLICGQWTTDDGKWSVLTEMLKAGSATPVIDRGIISCIVDTPLTSLGTVTADDLSGPITLPTGSSFTARLNTIFPRFTSEQHRWQMVQADTPVKAETYVTEDGAIRSKTLDWQYVPAVNQACQLAAYTITNGREISGIQLPGKPKLRNYTVGDCFTLDTPEAGLATTKVMVTKRLTDQSTGGVTLTVRTETDAKHPYSLGVSGVAPATPGISGFDPTILEAPLPDFWATGALEVTDPTTGESRVIVRVTGSADDNVYAQTVVLRWRPVALVGGDYTPTGDASWSYRSFPASQGQFDLDLNPGVYDVQIAYVTVNGAYPVADEEWLDLGEETIGGSTASNAASLGGTPATVLLDQIADLQSAQTDQGVLIGELGDQVTDAQGDLTELQGDFQGQLDANATANISNTLATNNETSARVQVYGEIKSQLDGLSSTVSTLEETSTDPDGTTANDIQELQSSVGDLQATATEQEGTNATLAGKLLAFLQFTAATNTEAASVSIAADNTTSTIKLIADTLSLASDQGGQPIDVLTVTSGLVGIATKLLIGSSMLLDPSTGTLYASLGSVALALGGPFGSSGDLIFWIGPNMALNAMTKSNGKLWFDQAGDGYFGGSLSAGTLTTKAGTSDSSTAATAETAVFGSNGGTITVTLSYSCIDSETAQYAAGGQSGYIQAKQQISNVVANGNGDPGFTAKGQDPGGFSVALYRSVNGGAFSQVATLNGQGSWNVTGEPPNSSDPGFITYSDAAGGSLTYTDPQQVAQNRQYQAVLTARNPQYAGAINQNISLICVEQ